MKQAQNNALQHISTINDENKNDSKNKSTALTVPSEAEYKNILGEFSFEPPKNLYNFEKLSASLKEYKEMLNTILYLVRMNKKSSKEGYFKAVNCNEQSI